MSLRPAGIAVGLGFLIVASSCGPPRGHPEAPAPADVPVDIEAPAATAGPLAERLPLVPVIAFTSPRDSITLEELREVLVPVALAPAVRAVLPGADVIGVDDPLRRAKDGAVIALVPPWLVDARVKTLAVNGCYFWDPGLDLARHPLWIAGTAQERVNQRWELLAAGEMIFGRGVQERIEAHHSGDARAVFTEVRDLVRSADLAVATMEAPLSGDANRWCDSCMRFIGNERYAAAVADAGFDVLSIAANHIGDAGSAGVIDTIRALDEQGLAHSGAGANASVARQPAIVAIAGLRIAIVAYNDVGPHSYAASPEGAGSAWLSHGDPSYGSLREDIAEARSGADVVVVMAHWGVEYEDAPRPQVVAAAHAMVEAGAALVIGDHPHWVQSAETYRGAYIACGVGNFVFDQMWSAETREGSIHQVFFDGARLVAVRIRPTIIDDFYRPRLLAPSEPAYADTLARIWRHSIIR